jgi:hypothetical protein
MIGSVGRNKWHEIILCYYVRRRAFASGADGATLCFLDIFRGLHHCIWYWCATGVRGAKRSGIVLVDTMRANFDAGAGANDHRIEWRLLQHRRRI